MKFAAAVATFGDAREAIQGAVADVRDKLGAEPPHFLALFATAHYEDEFPTFAEHLSEAWPQAAGMGCTAGAIIGEGRELENTPGLVLFAGSMPGAHVQSFRVDQSVLEAVEDGPDLLRSVSIGSADDGAIILLGDPFSIQVTNLIALLAEAVPACPVIGGMASGGERPGQNALLLNGEDYRDGAVGVVFTGNVRVDSVVSQGCRPIGESFVITKADRNVILELGGKPALAQLRSTFAKLDSEDRRLAETALFIGVVINEYQDRFRQGDFLVRHLLGWDPDKGALAIGDLARVGSTVQFHVRDAASADHDLRERLRRFRADGEPARGALLFTCNGRGTRMWDQPDHDIHCLREIIGDVPAGGFFCAGELGPVGGRSFLHGHTASIAVFGPKE